MMKKNALKYAVMMMAAMPLHATAQGTNNGLGGEEGDIKSLYEMVAKHEQKSKAFNFFINYGASYQMNHDSRSDEWTSRFYNRCLRIEMTGWLTDNLYYRFRHRLNKANNPSGEDNFAKATDYMMVGWKFNDHWAYTLRTQAKHKYSRFLRMGQKLNLDKLQWYLDYNMSYDDLDRMKIASGEVEACWQKTRVISMRVRCAIRGGLPR